MNKKAFVLITHKPNRIINYIRFLDTFNKYDKYLVIDDNSIEYNTLKTLYTNINFIQINNSLCIESGIKNLNTLVLKKEVSGWDKAIYSFIEKYNHYDYIWFCEDDVFFYDENTILQIDKNYPDQDLLCNSAYVAEKDDGWFWWDKILPTPITPPYYYGMMCISRMSYKLLESVKNYANIYKTLFFLEAFFTNLTIKNKLKVAISPPEFEYVGRKSATHYNRKNLYHPIKNLNNHLTIRNSL